MREMRTIALVDHTKKHRPPAGVLEAIAEALTIQVQRDFAPAWNVEAAQFTAGGRGDKIHFFDNAQEAEEFGWHVTDHHGLPYAHVFAGASISHGNGWTKGIDAISVTASHEALEMLADPRANEFCFGVTFDDAMPEWQRTLKLRGWGRTYWRLALNQ